MAHPQTARTACRYATPLAGGNASGPAKPVPRRSALDFIEHLAIFFVLYQRFQ